MATAKKRAAAKSNTMSKKRNSTENLIDQARERLEELRDSDQVQDAKKAYQQIWRAGLGAYAQSTDVLSDAAKETGDDSEKFFKKLVKDGEKLEKKAKKELDAMKDKVEDRWEEMTDQANQRVSKLESAFDKRVAQAINRLGLPAKQDIDALAARIEKLQRTLDGKKAPAKAKTRARTAPAAKTRAVRAKTSKAA